MHTETCTYIKILDAKKAVQIKKHIPFFTNYNYTLISVPILKTMVKMFWWAVHSVTVYLWGYGIFLFFWNMLLFSLIWSKFNHLGPPILLSIHVSLYQKYC